MEIENENIERIQSEGLGFLYKKCSIHPYIISNIADVPEYLNAVKKFDGDLNDDSIYEIIRDSYIQMLSEKKSSSIAKRVMRNISKSVKGDPNLWEVGLPNELLGASLSSREREWVYKMPPQKIYKIFRYDNISEAFRKFKVKDDVMAYDVCKILLFQMIFDGYDHGDQKTSGKYFALRKIVQDYAKALNLGADDWKNDYNNFLETKTFVVHKASRNGGYEKMYFTEEEIASLKQKDEQLDDADEDL